MEKTYTVGWVGGVKVENKATLWPQLTAEAESDFQLKLKLSVRAECGNKLQFTSIVILGE